MSQSYSKGEPVNESDNPLVTELNLTRRTVLQGTVGLLAMLNAPHALSKVNQSVRNLMQFNPIAAHADDLLTVPEGYEAKVLFRWGDAIGIKGTDGLKFSVSNSAKDQAVLAGMHHDGMEWFNHPNKKNRALLAVNHEYVDDGLLHSDGMKTWSAEKVAKAQAAQGVSVLEIEQGADKQWSIVKNSPYARRLTSYTPMAISGPAAGLEAMKTSYDTEGKMVFGTLNNCAAGRTPWGTYLTCEENWNGYFHVDAANQTPAMRRYGVRKDGFGYRWHDFDERFDANKHPNELNRFGWVVEIDPYNPDSTPIKRTALGRFKHESAMFTQTKDGRAVVYMGDDERFEYIYKFVSKNRIKPGGFAANKTLLDEGTLFVARFDPRGYGIWLPLIFGSGPLTAVNGFTSQGDVLIKTREAADAVGATKMDRPEWVAIHPKTGEVYVTLTNNSERGKENRAGLDEANPRAENIFGNIIRWREADGAASNTFTWNQFALAGDAASGGTIKGDIYGSPDGLWFDPNGLLWIQTDISTSTINKGRYANIGNNVMLVANPETGQTKRFLVGPRGCEVTGVVMSTDQKSMFVNIQHPGESPSERADPSNPKAISAWPDYEQGDRPRSATVVIRRKDNGIIGT